jgi:hypothetical protein
LDLGLEGGEVIVLRYSALLICSLIFAAVEAPASAYGGTKIGISSGPDIQLQSHAGPVVLVYGVSVTASATKSDLGTDETLISLIPEFGLRIPMNQAGDIGTYITGMAGKQLPIVANGGSEDLLKDMNDDLRFHVGVGLTYALASRVTIEGELGILAQTLEYETSFPRVDLSTGQVVFRKFDFDAVYTKSYSNIGIAFSL